MGNVLVYFSHDRMFRQMGAVCDRSASEMRSLLIDSELQWEFERGQVSEREFCGRLSQLVGRELEVDAVRQAGSDIFWPHPEMRPILEGLKKQGLRLVLLSNTSISHFEWIQQRYDFPALFDDLVLSYEVGAIKPEEAIFRAALDKIDCDPEECFYTDDISAYVAAGRTYGLQAEIFTGANDLREHLRMRGVSLE
ncbi:MAG: HAD family phosphatase [Planctomycetaceae bacterium]|nr:HAD family phosphatase [Planctomycetaceae bacterium]